MAKTKGQQQQQAGLNPKPSSSVSSPGKRGPPRDRASPSPGTTIKKRKSASANTSLDELAGVEGLEDIAPTSGASNSKEDALTPGFEATEGNDSSSEQLHPDVIESSSIVKVDAGKEGNDSSSEQLHPDVIESSSGTSLPDAEKEVLQVSPYI